MDSKRDGAHNPLLLALAGNSNTSKCILEYGWTTVAALGDASVYTLTGQCSRPSHLAAQPSNQVILPRIVFRTALRRIPTLLLTQHDSH